MSGKPARTKEEDEELLTKITDFLLEKIIAENAAADAASEAYDAAVKANNKEDMKKYLKAHDEHDKNSYALLAELRATREELKKSQGLTDEVWKPLEEKWWKEMQEEEQKQKVGGNRRIGSIMVGKTRRNKASGGDIVTHLLTIRNQVKLYHWQTGSFARHKATDDLTTALDTSIDAFVESYMGRYGRPKVSGSIKLHNFSESAAKAFVAKETKYLETDLPRKIGKGDTDLLNLRDTILGDLTKVSYLFTLA